jgi:hypothetical protein
VKIGSGVSVAADGTISVTSVSGYLPLAGGTMTGTINVPAAMDFISTKNGFGLYDNATGLVVRKDAATIVAFGPTAITTTVPVVLPADPTSALQAATKQYVDSKTSTYTLPAATASVLGGVKVGSGITVTADGTISVSGGAGGEYLPLTGGTVTGPINLPTTQSTSSTAAVHKSYVDGQDNLKVNKTGGTMTGALYLPSADPTSLTQAAHKSYVDSQVSSIGTTYVRKSGDAMTGPLRHSAAASPSTFNGQDWYVWHNSGNAALYFHSPAGRSFIFLADGTLQLQVGPTSGNHAANKFYVDNAVSAANYLPLTGGTMTGTIVAPTNVNTLTWAGTYNIFGSSNGWAVRSGTTNLLLATTTSVTAGVQLDVKQSGTAIRFGTTGPTITNISGVVSVTGNVESTAVAPTAASHLTRKDYVDNNFAPKALLDAAMAEIQTLRTELAAMKAQLTPTATRQAPTTRSQRKKKKKR